MRPLRTATASPAGPALACGPGALPRLRGRSGERRSPQFQSSQGEPPASGRCGMMCAGRGGGPLGIGAEQGRKQPGPPAISPSLSLESKSNRKNQSLDPHFRQDPSRLCSPPLGFGFSADEPRLGAGPGKGASRNCPLPHKMYHTDGSWREVQKTEWEV